MRKLQERIEIEEVWLFSCSPFIRKMESISAVSPAIFQTHTIQVAIEWRRPFMNPEGKMSSFFTVDLVCCYPRQR